MIEFTYDAIRFGAVELLVIVVAVLVLLKTRK